MPWNWKRNYQRDKDLQEKRERVRQNKQDIERLKTKLSDEILLYKPAEEQKT